MLDYFKLEFQLQVHKIENENIKIMTFMYATVPFYD